MSDEEDKDVAADEAEPKKSSPIKAIIAGICGAIGLGAVAAITAFVMPTVGQKCSADVTASASEDAKKSVNEDIVFVNLKPLVVTLGPNARADFLKISISIETSSKNFDTATKLQPRFRDVINTYLRSVEESDLVEPKGMTRLRSQLLRRLQVTASREVVSDVLITDFVLK
ncbi:MAG: flagellar basal body-associated FliL family protein [Marinicaulis sp.]|nr:flagellar basal body-associated FliL family protein [Marinicaulis sp.]NNE41834.1 flagellar basal body-associated FliL family protein [Marinicaulis sp.]NNL90312.1 flagellar basal body-associated FliL family protein [Marinicaulis sp.]